MLKEFKKEQEKIMDYETLFDLEDSILMSLDKIKNEVIKLDKKFDIETIDSIRTKFNEFKLKDKKTFYNIEFFLELIILDVIEDSNLRLFLIFLKERYPNIAESDLILRYFLDFVDGKIYGTIFLKLLYDFFKIKNQKELIRHLLFKSLMQLSNKFNSEISN